MDEKACTKCGKIKPLPDFHLAGPGRGRESACKECRNAARKAYRLTHPESYRAQFREYARAQRADPDRAARRREYQTSWARKNRHTDPSFKLAYRLRNRLRSAILLDRGAKKTAATVELLGCSIAEFRVYLEERFWLGMTWENYGWGPGKWNIDHIRPCASFYLVDPEQQRECFHWSNLQPLWSEDNMAKGASIYRIPV